MKKIPTVFERDWTGDRSRVIDKVHEGCEWVLDGEGWATRKVDGTCCRITGGTLFKRREVKLRDGDTLPAEFETEDFDEETKKYFGWMPVGDGPDDCWHREAFGRQSEWPNGTYELIGPRIQGNPEKAPEHTLVKHGEGLAGVVENAPRTYAEMLGWLAGSGIEGLVFYHEDGRRAKIKARDFGIRRS